MAATVPLATSNPFVADRYIFADVAEIIIDPFVGNPVAVPVVVMVGVP